MAHSGRSSCRIEPGKNKDQGGNARVVQNVPVRPHACYRLSCWVKTRDLSPTGSFHLLALGAGSPGRSLTFQEGGLEPTQDWKKMDVVFNTLDQTGVNIYAGFWGDGSGTLWIDDLRLEELSLVNVLRRKGCPLLVTSADGKTAYTPRAAISSRSSMPSSARFPTPGEFEYDHEGPRLTLTARSRIKEGERLLLSWYHPILTPGSQVMCCLSDPKVETILRDQARRVNAIFHPRTFFMSHDEIRVANWCQACQARKLSPGKMLADNVRRCVAILRQINPKPASSSGPTCSTPIITPSTITTWSTAPLKGSWEGLPRDVIIANWNSGKAHDSLSFFAGAGPSPDHRRLL